MAIQSELISAINQICSDRGIDKSVVFKVISDSIVAAIKRQHGENVNVEAEIDQETGEMSAFLVKEVVKKVKDADRQITVVKAKELGFDVECGTQVKIELPVSDFGRIAAQSAKNVLINGVRDAERNAVLNEIRKKIGTVISGKVQRMRGKNAIIELGRAMAILTPEEQIPGEFYKIGERYRILIAGVELVDKREEIIVSRSRPEFLRGLFALEIPEVSSGTVEIKGCVREVGQRSKVAVHTVQEGIDPQGACIGQRGIRINGIMNELGTEKVDIVLYSNDIERYIANALSPAKVISVKANVKQKKADVSVIDDQLSLAIGRDGQNVRLVAKLTGYTINIASPALNGKSISDKDEVTTINKRAHKVMENLDKETEVKKKTKDKKRDDKE